MENQVMHSVKILLKILPKIPSQYNSAIHPKQPKIWNMLGKKKLTGRP